MQRTTMFVVVSPIPSKDYHRKLQVQFHIRLAITHQVQADMDSERNGRAHVRTTERSTSLSSYFKLSVVMKVEAGNHQSKAAAAWAENVVTWLHAQAKKLWLMRSCPMSVVTKKSSFFKMTKRGENREEREGT
jgi:hypothetical protein